MNALHPDLERRLWRKRMWETLAKSRAKEIRGRLKELELIQAILMRKLKELGNIRSLLNEANGEYWRLVDEMLTMEDERRRFELPHEIETLV